MTSKIISAILVLFCYEWIYIPAKFYVAKWYFKKRYKNTLVISAENLNEFHIAVWATLSTLETQNIEYKVLFTAEIPFSKFSHRAILKVSAKLF